MLLGIWAILAGVFSLIGFTWLAVQSFSDNEDPLLDSKLDTIPGPWN